MSQQTRPLYEFDEGLPLNGVSPGTTLLVSGPAKAAGRAVAMRMVLADGGRDEGMVLVSPNSGGEHLLEECRSIAPGVRLDDVGVVDCATGGGAAAADVPVSHVSSPADLTGLGIEISGTLENLHRRGTQRVRVGMFSIATLLMYSELQPLSRFLHTVSGRIAAVDGLGVYSIDPDTQDERTVKTISHLCDGRVEVRAPEDRPAELRVLGLPDQPDDWTAIAEWV